MNLKKKVFLIVIGGFAMMAITLFILSRVAFTWASDSVARQDVLHTFSHAKALLSSELDHLSLLNSDWSVWDDLYEYVLHRNPRFVSANLQENTFRTLNLTSFLIYDSQDHLIFSFLSNSPGSTSDRSEALLPLRMKALQTGKSAKIVQLDNSFAFAAAHTILRSDETGPAVGTLIMTRKADPSALSGIMGILESKIVLELVDEDTAKSNEGEVFFKSGTYFAHGRIPDVADEAIQLRVQPEKRNISFRPDVFGGFILVGFVIAWLVTVFILFLLDRHIIQRINRIAKELEPVVETGRHTYRVTEEGNDEISRLGHVLNRTFESLEKSFAENDRSRILLEKTLSEKESLFQEIRHRVKNNLQVVASLLSLQADEAENVKLADAFQNSRRRVLAMAFVHEELYCSDTLNSIDLHNYLERLSILIRYALDPDELITFEFNAKEKYLSIEKAIPFALISNEVLSNAFTHAFPADHRKIPRAKKISLTLGDEADGQSLLIITDNGVGIAPLRSYKGTLGMILIDTLSNQLRATYSYESRPEEGTVFRLKFASDSCSDS